MNPEVSLEVHAVYGAIHRDGERVTVGEILGLSPDERELVLAPVSGRVRIHVSHTENGRRLHVTIEADTAPSELSASS